MNISYVYVHILYNHFIFCISLVYSVNNHYVVFYKCTKIKIYIYIYIYIFFMLIVNICSIICTMSNKILLYHTIPYHTIPYHTIPYHTIPGLAKSRLLFVLSRPPAFTGFNRLLLAITSFYWL